MIDIKNIEGKYYQHKSTGEIKKVIYADDNRVILYDNSIYSSYFTVDFLKFWKPYETHDDKTHDDKVNHPSHYNHGGMETIDKMIKLYGIEKVKAFCELNAFKYRDRAGYKGNTDGAIVRDIRKALWYENKYNELNNK